MLQMPFIFLQRLTDPNRLGLSRWPEVLVTSRFVVSYSRFPLSLRNGVLPASSGLSHAGGIAWIVQTARTAEGHRQAGFRKTQKILLSRLSGSEDQRSGDAPAYFEVNVGYDRFWTYHEWAAKPGILRKHNGAHGACGICEDDENPKRDLPNLAWELENLARSDNRGDTDGGDRSARQRRRKDTRRWCRGKMGVPHRASWRPAWPNSASQAFVCDSCGRKLEICFHPRWSISGGRCRCPKSLAKPGRDPPVSTSTRQCCRLPLAHARRIQLR